MPEKKVDQKFTDRSAEDFSKSIESGELYEELKNKDSEKDDSEGEEAIKRKAN